MDFINMHYRRLSTTRFGVILSRQPKYRLVLYAFIILLTLYTLPRTSSVSTSTSIPAWLPGSTTKNPVYPIHYSPLVNHPKHVWENRAEEVKYAFMHAYGGYEEYAAPFDELLPVSKGGINILNGWGLTVFDSLDTMLIMGLNEQYKRGLEIVKLANFTYAMDGYVMFFETVIRYLGGLLSAYALSPTKDQILLDRAVELVDKLDPVFNSTSGLAYYSVNTETGQHQGGLAGSLAEVATFQLEYTYLAKLTGRKEHFHRVNNAMEIFAKANLTHTGGMLPTGWHLESGEIVNKHLSVGAQADSAHEYLLKLYLLTAKKDKASLELYIRTTTHILTNLLFLSPTRHLLYVTDTTSSTYERKGIPSHLFEHLSCFLPGLLALGAHTLPLDNLSAMNIALSSLGSEERYGQAGKAYSVLKNYNLKQLHLWAAEGLAQTCWLTYADQPTGLSPDEIVMKVDVKPGSEKLYDDDGQRYYYETEDLPWIDAVEQWRKSGSRGIVPGLKEKHPVIYTEEERMSGKGSGRDYELKKTEYFLRPEAVETFYLLWKVTGDWIWRARAWAVFEAIEKESKTAFGYASLRNVDRLPGVKMNGMPSYFLAETLKYLYLTFKEEDIIPLDKWVFNTEAHPLPVFEWTQEEREKFNITFTI